MHLEIQGDGELTQDVKIVFYRVAQEALNRIAKHAGARQVELHSASQPGHIHLCIWDDGLGFEASAILTDHLGIAIMRERANSIGACLRIHSQPGQGATVELDWRSTRKEDRRDTSATIRVTLGDDHNVVRSGPATFLKANDDLALVGEARNGLEAVRL